jgi:SAM-dependent methyltransferase
MDGGRVHLNAKAEAHALYWADNDGSNLDRTNGFVGDPTDAYSLFLRLNMFGRILDLGCGNGRLLRAIAAGARRPVVPFGIDFLMPSVRQARTEVWPDVPENFRHASIERFKFDSDYDFILSDPVLIAQTHRKRVIEVAARHAVEALVLYSYTDALRTFSVRCPCEWGGIARVPSCRALELRDEHLAMHVCYRR